MKLLHPIPLNDLAQLISAQVIGNPDSLVTGINEIHKVEEGDLTFVDHPKYYERALASKASFILANKKLDMPEGKSLLLSDDPFRDYNKLVRHFAPQKTSVAMIDPGAQVGEGTVIEPGVFIGPDVAIGKNCFIRANVTICCPCTIGDNVIIHPNTVIGADAFYYKRNVLTRSSEVRSVLTYPTGVPSGPSGKRSEHELHHDKLLSCGTVVIGNDVEIGASCTIDRGVSGETRIGDGTKIDNLVHIAHGVVIGRNCLIAAQVGIAGKAIIEDNVTLWGQVGVSKDLTIKEGTEVYAQSGVAKSIGPGKWFGSPAVPAEEHIKVLSILKRLPELWEKLRGR